MKTEEALRNQLDLPCNVVQIGNVVILIYGCINGYKHKRNSPIILSLYRQH